MTSGRSAGQPETEQSAGTVPSSWALTTSAETRPPSGWLTFAGSMLGLLGIFNIITGITALTRPEYFLVTANRLLTFDYPVWGWIWLGLGIVQVVVGAGAMYGRGWARFIGIDLAALCAIGHLVFLTAFPLWSVLVIALSVMVIYGLVVRSAPTGGAHP
ncbi:hypothetical protein SAMN05421805_11364 [Saccharopolyspora antimicrobica]|uniref:DUF7144 domain-containing protein n=1 Tax=Saccharopolyspora antimicrobica TaxID=455193 RepID=A0A1I5GM36_9PSEU|nr:hypothetical protein [Saccharopolyspora antimicrobica]RKT87470.1 hypothetical protein ATL45_5889 [Saccharopolyspora antimicrobica]SFO36989.1 hypothetical protein SAMN05421805_11364 [Saccharopolyspora antimicrobica]